MTFQPKLDTYEKRPPLIFRVRVCECGSDEIIRTHHINFNKPEKRQWLNKILVWASLNHKYVEIINVADDTEDFETHSLTQ